MKVEFIPIKTRIVNPPKDEIFDILDGLSLEDGDVVFITSKILALHQGRSVKMGGVTKEELIKQEADMWLPYESKSDGWHGNLTITDNILIPCAGIDESNANGHYILWPKDVDALCRQIRARLMEKNGIGRLGVVSTDSHSMPLRRGVTGITTGFAGIEPLRDIRGEKDIFGRATQTVRINLIDPLAAMAVLFMGEGAEQIPIVILRGWDKIKFCEGRGMEDFKIPLEADIYQPLLEVMKSGSK